MIVTLMIRHRGEDAETGTSANGSASAGASTEEPAPPDAVASFVAGPPLVTGPGFARRAYTRGDATVTLTIARLPMGPSRYDQWVRQSQGGFAQAALDVPPGEGNGFYDCADAAAGACSLLIQLRTGLHVEIRGDAKATRADVDAMAAGLPLREWARRRDAPAPLTAP